MAPDDWLYRGPPLDELVASVSTAGTRSSKRCAIILPVHDELGDLKHHLGELKGQTSLDFDAIIVHSPGLDLSWLGKMPYGMVVLALKKPLGAGAYYAGQKYAIEQGYPVIILADVDSMPASPGTVQRLAGLASSDKNSVFLPSLKPRASGIRESTPIHWYGAMNRSVLERSGLTYLPLFFGGVDTELEQRMAGAGIRFERVKDVFTDHPLVKALPPEQGNARLMYHVRNLGLMMYYSANWAWVALSLAFCSLCFFDRPDRFYLRMRWMLEAMRDQALLDLSSRYAAGRFKLPPYPEASLGEAHASGKRVLAVIARRNSGEDAAKDLGTQCSGLGIPIEEPLSIVRKPVSYLIYLFRLALRSDTLIMCMGGQWNFSPPLLLAPNLYVNDGGRLFAVQRSSGALSRWSRFMASMSALALLTAIYLPVSFISSLRLSGAVRGYGIPKKKNKNRIAKDSIC